MLIYSSVHETEAFGRWLADKMKRHCTPDAAAIRPRLGPKDADADL